MAASSCSSNSGRGRGSGGRGGGRGRGREDSRDTRLSKFLSYICRHGAESKGLTVHEGGYINVSDILSLREADKNGYTPDDVQRVVTNCSKQRFCLRDDPQLQIRANQGHTMEVDGLDLTPITSPDEAPVVVHGTYNKAWDLIKPQGLSRMARNHVHFAAGLPGEDGVISGMRSSCQVLVYINLRKALQDGLLFYRSSNNVILCPGDQDGFIHPRYFEKVCEAHTGKLLDY